MKGGSDHRQKVIQQTTVVQAKKKKKEKNEVILDKVSGKENKKQQPILRDYSKKRDLVSN